MNRLLIATNNLGKMEEMQALLAGLPVELVTPEQLGLDMRVPEDGKSYAENAEKKAVAFARLSGLVSLADDFGLEVLQVLVPESVDDALSSRIPTLHTQQPTDRFRPQSNTQIPGLQRYSDYLFPIEYLVDPGSSGEQLHRPLLPEDHAAPQYQDRQFAVGIYGNVAPGHALAEGAADTAAAGSTKVASTRRYPTARLSQRSTT